MKLKSIIMTTIAAPLVLTGCDFLDKMPDDQKTMDMVWENRVETEAYLYNIYSQIPQEYEIWDHCPWVGASDEADMIWDRYLTASMNRGAWNPSQTYYVKWGSYYKAIRCSYVFENNVERCPELTPELVTQYKAESTFLRGYFYWKLLQQYGPFVWIEGETQIDDDWNSYPRMPYDECVEKIIDLINQAEAVLPWSWKNNPTWLGKPDKMVCKAVKAEVLMMAASPQWNGNKDYESFRNQDGTPLVNTTYSEEKWRRAAEAVKEIIDIAETRTELGIKLYRNDEQDGGEFSPYISYRDLFLKKFNCEVIWSRDGNNINEIEKHSCPRPGGWSGIAPTQRQVDAYYMEDGLTIEDSPNYVETGFAATDNPHWAGGTIDDLSTGEHWGHRAGEWNMYANREARFYVSILYNGRPVPQVDQTDRNVYSSAANVDGWGRAELYGNGASGANGNADHSATGYLMLKYVSPDSNPYRSRGADWRPYIVYRLGRFYLDYIEALNEIDPNNEDIKIYWDRIRSRAGLPSIFDTYPNIKGDKELQLEYILRERQVELAFEGDRYFTTRRRWIAHTTDTERDEAHRRFGEGGPMYGLNVTVGNSFSDTEFYQRTMFEERVYDMKMNIFPIEQSEMDRNKSMVQNPGW